MALFRYSAGEPGRNLVKVYERYAGGPLQVEMWPRGRRKRESLRKVAGRPIRDQALARQLADRIASELNRDAEREDVRALLGIPDRHTLGELLEEYHTKRERRWAGSNLPKQRVLKQWWADRLGADVDVRQVRTVDVEEIVADEADLREWSPRTEAKFLKYLITAFNFGRLKLKWYGEEATLSAVDVPSPDPNAPSYDTDEIRAMLQRGLPAVDLRAAVAGHVAYVSLRRITAIRKLSTESWRVREIELDGELVRVGTIQFPRATDKARKTGLVALAGEALEQTEALLCTPAVRASGLLFPAGDLEDINPHRKPVPYEDLNAWLHEAETLAGVPTLKGRAWHAFKRRAATDAEDEMGSLKEASSQGGTLESTLRGTYKQHDLKPKALLALRLARRVA
jgi:hypothetical protein